MLKSGYSLATFDYNGLGHSDKLPISYGFHEKNDLKLFLDLLQTELKYKNLLLWGRSMGTQTVL